MYPIQPHWNASRLSGDTAVAWEALAVVQSSDAVNVLLLRRLALCRPSPVCRLRCLPLLSVFRWISPLRLNLLLLDCHLLFLLNFLSLLLISHPLFFLSLWPQLHFPHCQSLSLLLVPAQRFQCVTAPACRPAGYRSSPSPSCSSVGSEIDESIFGDMSPEWLHRIDDFMASEEGRGSLPGWMAEGQSIAYQTDPVPTPTPPQPPSQTSFPPSKMNFSTS